MVYKVRRKYTPTKGIDLKTGDKIRPMDMLSGGQNCIYDQQGNIVKRPGFHQRIVNSSLVWGGIYPFKTTDYKGVTKSELIGLGRKPYRLARHTLTVTHAGATIGMYVSAAQFHFVMVDAGVTVLDQALGDGTATGVFTVLQLANAINAIAGFTAVASAGADTSVDAFHLNVQEPTVCPAGGVVFDWYVWEAIPEPSLCVTHRLNHTNFNGAANTILLTAHGLSNGNAVVFCGINPGEPAAIPDPLVCNTTYYVVNAAANTFQLSATVGGAAIDFDLDVSEDVFLATPGGPVITRDDDHLPSAVTLNGCLYVTTGGLTETTSQSPRWIGKYDGQMWYRAGLAPYGYSIFNSRYATAGGAVTDCRGDVTLFVAVGSDRAYCTTAVYVDKAGQRFESFFGNTTTNTTGSSEWVCNSSDGNVYEVAPINAINDLRGVNDHKAQCSATTTGLTIPVDAGHTMIAGDVAYFWNNDYRVFCPREVVSVTANSITLSPTAIEPQDFGGNVTVQNNALITANMRLAIYATVGGIAGEKYLVAEIPLDVSAGSPPAAPFPPAPVTTSQYLFDDFFDTTLQRNPVYVASEFIRQEPPQASMLAKYLGLLLFSGQADSPNTVFFSERGNIESVPRATHAFDVDSTVKALATSESMVAVGQERGLDTAVGDLESFNFRVSRISDTFRAIAPLGAVEVEENIAVFQTPRGPFQAAAGRNLAPVGPAVGSPADSAIEPAFYCNYPHTLAGAYIAYPDIQKTIACVHPDRKWFIVHIPWGTDAPTGSAVTYGITGHRTFVYDFARHCWLPEWTGLDMRGGMAFWEGSFWYLSRNPATGLSTLWQMQETHGIYNLADGVSAIDAQAITSWEALQQAEVYKKYLWMDVFAVGSPNSATWTTRVRSLPNYDYATTHTDASVPFTSSTQAKEFKLKDGKAASMAWMFSNATIYEDFMVSGFAVDIATPIKPPSSPYGVDG